MTASKGAVSGRLVVEAIGISMPAFRIAYLSYPRGKNSYHHVALDVPVELRILHLADGRQETVATDARTKPGPMAYNRPPEINRLSKVNSPMPTSAVAASHSPAGLSTGW